MDAEARRPVTPLLIGILFAAATVAFVWGAFAERSGHHDAHAETPTQQAAESGSATTTASAGGETPAEHAAESGTATTTTSVGGETAAAHAAESGSATTRTSAETEFHPLGVNLESNPLIIAAALLSLLLASVVVLRPRRVVLGTVVVVAVAFTMLEVVEVNHQASQSRPGLVALAVVAGLFHAAVVVLAAIRLAPTRRVVT